MTDTQILTLVIGITFPVLGLVLSIASLVAGNKRLDDFHKSLDRSLTEFEKRLEARADGFEKRIETRLVEFEKRIDNGFAHMELLLKLHEAEHHK